MSLWSISLYREGYGVTYISAYRLVYWSNKCSNVNSLTNVEQMAINFSFCLIDDYVGPEELHQDKPIRNIDMML